MSAIDFYRDIFKPAQRVVRYSRNWYYREINRYPLHPVIVAALKREHRPRDWHLLLLEHPHRSETDPTRLAYTRSERDGENNRQVITTLGKYLTRHFDLPDHMIRDIVALDAAHNTDAFEILDTVDQFVHAVNNGPHSCMCWSGRDNVYCRDGKYRHPYAVYKPEYGWRMAVRKSGGEIKGRALLNVEDDTKYFVRSYKRSDTGGYSYADEKLEAWLKSEGYVHQSCWHDGARMELIPTRYGAAFLAPYLDGEVQTVYIDGDTLRISQDSYDYICNNTDGTAEEHGRCTCEHCGARVSDGDLTYTGYHEDYAVCQSCIDDDYVYAIGRRGNEYYAPYNECVEVDGNYYVSDYLSDNEIVELHNGDYCRMDDAVMCDDDDEWYRADDDNIIYCAYDSKHHHIDNCVETEDEGLVHEDDAWQCYASDKWYSDNTASVTIDGERYHPDHAPAEDEAQQELFNTQE
jgi:hypothetical protein